MKYRVIALAIVIVAQLVGVQLAHTEPRMPDEPGRGRRGEFFRDLDLSDTQRAKMKELREKYGSPRDNMQKISDSRQKLLDLLKDPKSTDEEIRAYVQKMSEDFTTLSKNRTEKMLEMRRVLTKAQFSKLVEKIKEMRGHFQQRRPPPPEDQRSADGEDARQFRRPPPPPPAGNPEGDPERELGEEPF